jgi:hypothetical protein
MAEAANYTVILGAVDKISEVLKSVEGTMAELEKAGAKASVAVNLPASTVHQSWWGELKGHFGELKEHVGEAKEKFEGFGEKLSELGETATDILPALSGLAGISSFAGLVEMAHSTAEAAEQLSNVSKIIGTPIANIQGLEYAAKQAGVSSDTFTGGLEKLNVVMAQAAGGKNASAVSLFKAMGVTLKDTHGHIKNVTDIMPQLESAFQKTADATTRGYMAKTLFGISGEQMLPFMTEGPQEISENQDKFKKLGYGINKEDSENLEKFNQSFNDATLAVSGLGQAIGAKLSPVLAPMLEGFATWVGTNQQWIATDIATHVKDFGIGVEYLDGKFTQFSSNFEAGAGYIEQGAQQSFASVRRDATGMVNGVIGDWNNFKTGAAYIWHGVGGAVEGAFTSIESTLGKIGGGALTAVENDWKNFQTGLKTIFDTIRTDFDAVFNPISGTLDSVGKEISSVSSWWDGGANGPQGHGAAAPDAPAPHGGRFSFLQPGQSLRDYLPSASPDADSGGGRHQLDIVFHNAPQGMTATATASGNADPARIQNVGTNGTISNHR